MFKKFKTDYYLMALLAVAGVFLAFYSLLAVNSPADIYGQPRLIFNSPDETANYFYSRMFAEKSELKQSEPANDLAGGLVSPRSTRYLNGYVVPAGFIGLPIIYGFVAKLFGLGTIVFLTPIIASLGMIFFYFLLKEYFHKKTAFFSALFGLALPGYWYYATRGLMPNILFTVLVIISLFLTVKALKRGKLWLYLLTGLAAGLAIMVRASDAVWFLPLLLAIILINYKKVKWLYLAMSLATGFLGLLPMLIMNHSIYGGIFSFGYDTELVQNVSSQFFSSLGRFFMPFGFHPRTALQNLTNYSYVLFPWWTIAAVAGFFLVFIIGLVNRRRVNFTYFSLFLIFSAYLALYYGSWSFHDNPDPTKITIGTSYIRYWLFIYLFSLPIIISPIVDFFGKFKAAKLIFLWGIWLIFFTHSFELVMLEQQEGILKVYQNLKDYQKTESAISAVLPDNAIIIADTADKIFFPKTKVIFRLNNDQDYLAVKKLVQSGQPLYYFFFSRNPEELEYFSQKYFAPFGLRISPSILDFSRQSLYPIVLREEAPPLKP